jgi:RNA polymerase sigma-70 factor (ECF subfamily)
MQSGVVVKLPPAAAEPLVLLVERVAAGDVAAFSALHLRTTAQVYRTVFRVLRQHAFSQEVAQEVYVEVWQQAHRHDPARGTVEAWLTTIARNRALSRRRGEQASIGRDHRHAQDAHEPDDAAKRVIDKLQAEAIRRNLRQLTPLQLQTVVLHYYYGCTTADIATRLGIPHGTAKTRLRDGVARLRNVAYDELAAD